MGAASHKLYKFPAILCWGAEDQTLSTRAHRRFLGGMCFLLTPNIKGWDTNGMEFVCTFISAMDSSFCCSFGFLLWKSSIRFLMLVPISAKFRYMFCVEQHGKQRETDLTKEEP